ncbi:hypothetical protein C2S52_011676 [Perilla frutescens var. hirtella]|nr:hypothetical protein C2S52_011676 [Perilla frutescens var. hirtella]
MDSMVINLELPLTSSSCISNLRRIEAYTLHDHDPSRDVFHEHDLSKDVFYDYTSSTQPFCGPVDLVIPWTMSQRQAFVQDIYESAERAAQAAAERAAEKTQNWLSSYLPQFFRGQEKVRRRATSAALRSLFLPNDKRFDNWNNFLQSKKLRNLGIGYGVGGDFFTELLKPGELTDAYIDAYMCILHTNSAFASRTVHKMDLVLTSTGFMVVIRKVFEQYHDLEGAAQLNKDTEQMIFDKDPFGLSQYFVFVTYLDSDHWVTCVVSFIEHVIAFYDSTWHNWTKEIRQSRINFFAPLTRILPQLLKYCGYWDCRKDLQPKYTEWKMKIVERAGVYKQNDGVNCGLYALKFVEMLMTNTIMPQPTDKEMEGYRSHMAHTVFRFSTDENTLRPLVRAEKCVQAQRAARARGPYVRAEPPVPQRAEPACGRRVRALAIAPALRAHPCSSAHTAPVRVLCAVGLRAYTTAYFDSDRMQN